MPVIARDAVASDHLVYAWPFPIGPEECEVACAEDELVVMCPAWLVGDRLGPGRHRWRTPDPTRPVAAYFVLTAPVEVSFDVMTQFVIPMTGQAVRVRANGSLQVRCGDPTLLVAQFVGLPFDTVNDGVLRSVSRSVERMLARLLTRRVVMAGTPHAVTDPQMLAHIVDELIAYNPTAGAVFGIELVRFGHLQIFADDGTQPWNLLGSDYGTPPPPAREERTETKKTVQQPIVVPPNAERTKAKTDPPPMPAVSSGPPSAVSGEIVPKPKAPKITSPGLAPVPPGSPTRQTPVVPPPIPAPPSAASSGPMPVSPPTPPPIPPSAVSSSTRTTASGVVSATPRRPGSAPSADDSARSSATASVVSGEIGGKKPASRTDDVAFAQGTPAPQTSRGDGDSRGAILGIGVAHIGSSEVVGGEITKKIAPGARVLVPGPNGLMQSATVRQLLQGYYELEVGGSGETIWVPVNGVVPES